MLVISRKVNESVMIGGEIEIIISEISGDKVQLAIHAPREMTILRKELYETICVNQEATQPVAHNLLLQLVDAVHGDPEQKESAKQMEREKE